MSPTAYSSECLDMHVILNYPLGYLDSEGVPTGIHWDFLQAIEQRSGICFNKKLIPYPRIWKSMEYGEHDGGIVFRSKGRDAIVEYVAPVLTLRTIVVPRKGISIKHYQDLKEMTIGKVRGIRLDARFDHDPDLVFVEQNNYVHLWKILSRSRVDAIAGSEKGLIQSGTPAMKEYLESSRVFVLGERVQWLQLSKKSKYLHHIPTLKTTIQSLLDEGVYDKLMAKHEKKSK